MSLAQRMAHALALTGALGAPISAHADEKQPVQLTEKQKESLEEHKYKLRNGYFRKGSISNLDPENASADLDSKYYQAFENIRDFLAAYDRKMLPTEEQSVYDDAIDALRRNMFVPNHTVLRAGFREGVVSKGINDEIRETLKKEGVLDYGRQLDDLVDLGTNALKEAGRIATLSKPEEYEQAKAKVETLHESVITAQQLADATIRRALEERLRPVTHAPGEIDDARIEVIRTAREAYDHLSKLQEAMDKNDAAQIKTKLKEWRSKLKKMLDDMHHLAKSAGEQTLFELGRQYEWSVLVVREERRINDENGMLATKAFAEEWGKNGEHFYSRLDKLKGSEEGFMKLEAYLEEKRVKQVNTRAPASQGGSRMKVSDVHLYLPPGLGNFDFTRAGIDVCVNELSAKGSTVTHSINTVSGSKRQVVKFSGEILDHVVQYLGLPRDKVTYVQVELGDIDEGHEGADRTFLLLQAFYSIPVRRGQENYDIFNGVERTISSRLGPSTGNPKEFWWKCEEKKVIITLHDMGAMRYEVSKLKSFDLEQSMLGQDQPGHPYLPPLLGGIELNWKGLVQRVETLAKQNKGVLATNWGNVSDNAGLTFLITDEQVVRETALYVGIPPEKLKTDLREIKGAKASTAVELYVERSPGPFGNHQKILRFDVNISYKISQGERKEFFKDIATKVARRLGKNAPTSQNDLLIWKCGRQTEVWLSNDKNKIKYIVMEGR